MSKQRYQLNNQSAKVSIKAVKSRFTIIELLVVIAIIGILVSILLPSLRNARKMTERAVCMSNLKQCSYSNTAYSVKNNALLPYGFTKGGRPGDRVKEVRANQFYDNYNNGDLRFDLYPVLRDYYSDFSSWKCGALRMAAKVDAVSGMDRRSKYYTAFEYYPYRNHGNLEYMPGRLSKVNDSSTAVMMQDQFRIAVSNPQNSIFNHGFGDLKIGGSDHSCSAKLKGDPSGGDGANILYYDGHVKFVNASALENVGYWNWGVNSEILMSTLTDE